MTLAYSRLGRGITRGMLRCNTQHQLINLLMICSMPTLNLLLLLQELVEQLLTRWLTRGATSAHSSGRWHHAGPTDAKTRSARRRMTWLLLHLLQGLDYCLVWQHTIASLNLLLLIYRDAICTSKLKQGFQLQILSDLLLPIKGCNRTQRVAMLSRGLSKVMQIRMWVHYLSREDYWFST